MNTFSLTPHKFQHAHEEQAGRSSMGQKESTQLMSLSNKYQRTRAQASRDWAAATNSSLQSTRVVLADPLDASPVAGTPVHQHDKGMLSHEQSLGLGLSVAVTEAEAPGGQLQALTM